MVDFDFIRVHLLSPPACVCASACSRYAARRITSRMPPAAWSGQWVSNAGGHQSRDLNPVFIAGKRLFADRDKWRQNPPTGSANRSRRPTAFAQSRHVAVIHGQFGKSQFAQDCVVGLGGLELPTKRLSVASSERSVRGALVAISWLAKCPKWRGCVYGHLCLRK